MMQIHKNVDKTAGHFAQMEPVEITEAPSLGVEKFFSPVTAALELIFYITSVAAAAQRICTPVFARNSRVFP